jgi:hypothetical protein
MSSFSPLSVGCWLIFGQVWVVDVHLDGSNQTIPAIIDIGSQVRGYRETAEVAGMAHLSMLSA